MSWVKYLVYIMSFLIPPVGVVTFWVFGERDEEPTEIARWSFLAAFIGMVAWAIVFGVGASMERMFWHWGRW